MSNTFRAQRQASPPAKNEDEDAPRPKRSRRDDEDTVIIKLPLVLPDEESVTAEVPVPAAPGRR